MPPIEDLHIVSILGLLLGISLAAGILADFIHLPKVSAYLIVGVILGPQVMYLVDHERVDAFDPMLKLAMALVLFNLGCHFVFGRLRRIAARGILISAGELLATFALTTIGLAVFGADIETSILLGCLALATAPATTILVLKEFKSSGPVTEYTGFLVALNNLAAIVLFEVTWLVIPLFSGTFTTPLQNEFGYVLQDIGGSFGLGLLGGVVVSYSCGLLSSGRWLVMLVASTTFLLGVCESFDLPYMLTFLVMGVTVANTSDASEKIVDELNHLTGLLCVLFFAIHGAELELVRFLELGTIGVVYIICRMAGKYFGVYAASRMTHQPLEVTRWLGPCLVAQAGAAIALAKAAALRDPERGQEILTIILGTVVVFEIVGPLMIRFSLLRAGEIPISHAIHHTSRTPLTQFFSLFDRFRSALGSEGSTPVTPPKERVVGELLMKEAPIPQTYSFSEVISHIEHCHDNTFPVVNDMNEVVGVIRYPLLANVMFDKTVADLVRAEDLATPATYILYDDDPALRAIEMFNSESDDCLPVISREEPHIYLGVVRRNETMRLLIRQHRKM